MRAIPWIALITCAATFAAGCGSNDSSATRPSTAKQLHAPPATTVPSTVWGRHDAPPEGVRRQVDFYGVGDSICGPPVPGPPRVELDRRPIYQSPIARPGGPTEAEIGETVHFCPRGFRGDGPVSVTMRRADGREYHAVLESKDDVYVGYFIDGSWPLGTIDVTAGQGDTAVRFRATVILPRHHGVRTSAIFYSHGRASPLVVVIVGQKPSSRVFVDLYRGPYQHFTYITSVRALSDARGIAQLRLRHSPDVNGTFVLRARSSGRSTNQDEVSYVGLCRNEGCT